MVQGLTARHRRRGAGLAVLVAAVVAAHGCVGREVAGRMAEMASGADPIPPRMTATYLRAMAPTEPVVAARQAAATRALPPSRIVAAAPDTVASAASSAAVTEVASAASAADEAPQSVASASAASAPEPAASASGLQPFEWPLATRVTYRLTGNYRGELAGTAQVEWLRDGPKYQVHLDVYVGLQVAPFMSRRMSSEGLITDDGLQPQRYDQQTKLPFTNPTRAVVRLGDDVELANGQRRPRVPGLQDTASQFVHLAWRFSTQPSLLKPGALISVPLAMPRSVETMQYDVSEPETLHTDFGEIPVIRLKPRLVPRAGGDLSVEMWLAPQYRYLPLRLEIHQDTQTYVDLVITKPPELGGG